MGNNLGTQPDTRFQFQFRQFLKEFLNIIGGSPESEKETEIDKEVEKIEKCEDKDVIENLEKLVRVDENNGGKGKKKSRNQKSKSVIEQSESKVQKQQSTTTRPIQNRTNTERKLSKDDDYIR